MTTLTVIISALNEEQAIGSILRDLDLQTDSKGEPLDGRRFNILVVDNGSTDNTIPLVTEFSKRTRLRVGIISESVQNIVAARIAGVKEIGRNPAYAGTEILVFCDADVVAPQGWINSTLTAFETGSVDVLSFNGSFPHRFWKKVPGLAERYMREIGTLFFPLETIRFYGAHRRKVKLSHKVFSDFVRPPSGGFYAIRMGTYKAVGGYQREFTLEGKEVDGPTWRLYAKLCRAGARLKFMPEVEIINSERRLLCNPMKFFGIQNYDQLGDLRQDYRCIDSDAYARVEAIANTIEFESVRRYALEYYVLFPCLNDPELLVKNRKYFGSLAEPVTGEIRCWKAQHPDPTGQELFRFCDLLMEKYFHALWEAMPAEEW